MSGVKRARDAITGRFVTLAYAMAHPKTTIVQLVRKAQR